MTPTPDVTTAPTEDALPAHTYEHRPLSSLHCVCGDTMNHLATVRRQQAALDAVTELAELWADPVSHADWCCMKGCVQPDGQHIKPGALDNLAFGVIPIPLPQVACPGTCTCEVELFAAPLRTALASPAPTEATT